MTSYCGLFFPLQMKTQNGSVQVNGRLALVTQQAWIYNDTFRENLIVGQQYDPERYKNVLRVCSLESDVELLVSGEKTEIGERGTNLRY